MSRMKAVISRVVSIKKLEGKISKLEETLKGLKAQRSGLEKEAMEFMTKEGLTVVNDGKYRIAIRELDVPTIKNFMETWEWARKNNKPEIFQRRVSSRAWKEHDMKVPGIGTFTKRSLSITGG